MPESPFATILLVDDSRADVRLMQLWMRHSAAVCSIQVVHRGTDALAFLRRQGEFAQAPRPHLILLDVHLPDMLAWQLLEELGRDESLVRIPVIVLSGTRHPEDEQLALRLGAVRYLTKPFDAEEFSKLVAEIDGVLQRDRPRESDPA